MTAKKFFKNEFGSDFNSGTLHGSEGDLGISMKDIHDVMEAYLDHCRDEWVKKMEAIIDTQDGDGMQRSIGREQCIKILKGE